MKNKNTLSIKSAIFLFLFMLVFITGSITMVYARLDSNDNLAQARHQRIISEFDKGEEWIEVSISISSSDVKQDVITSLSKNEFRLDPGPSTPRSIFGEVTLNGINKLANNSYVTSIDIGGIVSTL